MSYVKLVWVNEVTKVNATNLNHIEDGIEALDLGKQDKLIAGTGISLIDNVISVISSCIWGQITGTLSNQTDLQNALNAKQDLINDLASIREGASKGATALQEVPDTFAQKTYVDTSVGGEATTRQAQDTLLSNAITNESTRATAKENELENDIDTHTSNTSNPHNVTKSQVGLGNVDNTSDINKPISNAVQNALDEKQDIIEDLSTIRSNAQAGKNAKDTIDGYGNVVTHDTDEFATSSQGAKADTALQPSALNDYSTTTEMNNAISNHHDSTKQDVISDLETIRDGAGKGATSVQPSALNDYSTTTEMNTAINNHHDSTKQNVLTPIAPMVINSGELRIELGNGVWNNQGVLEAKPGNGILVDATGIKIDETVVQPKLSTAQLNAVNSGITANKVSTYDGYANQIDGKSAVSGQGDASSSGNIWKQLTVDNITKLITNGVRIKLDGTEASAVTLTPYNYCIFVFEGDFACTITEENNLGNTFIPEYKAFIDTITGNGTLTFPSGTTIISNDSNISISSNVATFNASTMGHKYEISIQNNICYIFKIS